MAETNKSKSEIATEVLQAFVDWEVSSRRIVSLASQHEEIHALAIQWEEGTLDNRQFEREIAALTE